MLDDLKVIHERDAQDALGIAEKQWQQVEQNYEIPDLNGEYDNVVLAGMGGSALSALIAQSWPGFTVPFQISRDYNTPSYIGAKTLFVAYSYSGNTEETLSALAEAEKAGCKITIIASGGKLVEIAKDKNYPLAVLPDVGQPRFGALCGLKALITIAESAGLVAKGSTKALEVSAEHIKSSVQSWLPTAPTSKNYAKQLALELMGRSVVVYSGPKLFPAAYKWKISFNENAKNVAWCNQVPEFNHNEMLGWTSHPVDKPYAVVDLRSNLEHPRVQKRFEVTERLLSGRRPAPNVIQVQGETLLEQLLWTIALGDFVSLYVAILNGLNPTPVDLIEKFKKTLDE